MRAHRHCVLVVDDHEDTREALEAFLRVRGFEVLLAENGRTAIARLRSGVDCCVILLDWHMPEMDGAAFMAVRNTDPALARLPVVIATGDPYAVTRTLDAKPVPVLAKPFDPEVLAWTLVHEVDGHRVRFASRDHSTACRPGPASSGHTSP
jgi:CheY-like chemotaxis protein